MLTITLNARCCDVSISSVTASLNTVLAHSCIDFADPLEFMCATSPKFATCHRITSIDNTVRHHFVTIWSVATCAGDDSSTSIFSSLSIVAVFSNIDKDSSMIKGEFLQNHNYPVHNVSFRSARLTHLPFSVTHCLHPYLQTIRLDTCQCIVPFLPVSLV